jgi:uncharacterized DUF497 family protein
MRITFDPLKREKALADRGLDFADVEIVFQNSESSVSAYWQGGWSSSDTPRVARIATYSA